ncbi:DNA-binding MarR family transcriptional regulator [Kitasatospora sp. MAP12-15]|uniref:MarR family winged helix-turn-helix transcriptional regulator n=1 Tax=unclassified Kitasatospora TaxID=2633591 RepID=UPI002476242A|nr:MarR family transcriptional regulator [Kitasatospora sp. MAP12-44]MDH6113768.1 DNA-binding MarR family transcriptional regulator [Kitasatospora sp. MAP12-44]
MNYNEGATPDDEPFSDTSLGQLFAHAARLSGSVWLRLLNDRLGIGWTAFNVLRQLDSEDGQTSKDIARVAMVAAPTLTGVVDTMEKDGLIERRRSETDRRVVRLFLTEAGRQRLAMSAGELSERFDVLFEPVDPADEPAIRQFLIAAVERFSIELGLPPAHPPQP